jgi:hypothetical protein
MRRKFSHLNVVCGRAAAGTIRLALQPARYERGAASCSGVRRACDSSSHISGGRKRFCSPGSEGTKGEEEMTIDELVGAEGGDVESVN